MGKGDQVLRFSIFFLKNGLIGLGKKIGMERERDKIGEREREEIRVRN